MLYFHQKKFYFGSIEYEQINEEYKVYRTDISILFSVR